MLNLITYQNGEGFLWRICQCSWRPSNVWPNQALQTDERRAEAAPIAKWLSRRSRLSIEPLDGH
jgi:hypothetical protein